MKSKVKGPEASLCGASLSRLNRLKHAWMEPGRLEAVICRILSHNPKKGKRLRAGSHLLPTLASPASASCWVHGATFLLLFNLLFREAEDKVPDGKHSFVINARVDLRRWRK